MMDDKLMELCKERRKARRAWFDEWDQKSFGYHMTHKNNGNPSYGWVVLVVTMLIVGSLFYLLFVVPNQQIGGKYFHLENGINYECPSHDWNGNTSHMDMISGNYGRYYYCPVDGRFIGYQSYTDPNPFLLFISVNEGDSHTT